MGNFMQRRRSFVVLRRRVRPVFKQYPHNLLATVLCSFTQRRGLARPPSLVDVYFFCEQLPHILRPSVPRRGPKRGEERMRRARHVPDTGANCFLENRGRRRSSPPSRDLRRVDDE